MTVERKTFTSRVFYRIKPASGGGFIAEAEDGKLPALEAATREELIEKIKSTITPFMPQEFRDMKLPLSGTGGSTTTYEIESKPGGGFTVHSSDPAVKPIETSSFEEADRQLEQQLAGTLGKDLAHKLTHEFSQSQGLGENAKVTVDERITLINQSDLTSDSKPTLLPGWKRNVPITPENGSNSALLWLFVALIAIGALIYLLAHR